jgi:tetratricopeptide (TPR) repeat protein
MTRRFLLPLIALSIAAAAVGARAALSGPAAPPGAEAARAARAADDESARRDADVALFEARIAGDPFSAGDRARLAHLYLQRARETGDDGDLARAEDEAAASLALRDGHNAGALRTLVGARMARHRFAEAVEAAERLFAREPEKASVRAMLGEARMELGDYDGAAAAFGSVERARADLSVAPRLARWAELRGETSRARALLTAAAAEADGRTDLPAEQRAWFHLRVGDLELRDGRPDAAEAALGRALALRPGDARVLAAMARAAAARGDWSAARAHGEASLAAALDPATLALLSDVEAAAGDAARSAEYARAAEVAVSARSEGFHRAWGLFLVDRGRRVPEVVALARAELRTRRDVYGHDLLAWALVADGKPAEARREMREALRLGTRDALLRFHAGMIERAAGDDAAAAAHLRAALEIDARFHPRHAATARATLRALEAGGAGV